MSFGHRLCLGLLTLGIWASPVVGQASPAVAEIAGRLETTPIVRVAFRQARHMEILSKPIVTEGRLVFSQGQGIAWLIEAPFQTRLALTGTHVTEWGDGVERRRSLLSGHPGLASLVSILVPLLSGTFDELEEDFIVEASILGEGWEATLVPRSGAMIEVISSIELSGDTAVREIAVRELGGDWTHISFDAYSPMPNRLTAEELAYFAE